MSKKVLLTDYGFSTIDYERNILSMPEIELVEAQCKTEEEVIALGEDAHALLVQWAPVTRKVISQLKNCELIVRYGIGVDNIDLQAAKEYHIPVANVPDYCIEEVATHTLALALALQRRLVSTDRRIRDGVWKIIPPGAVRPASETTFIVMGFGRIARSVAAQARALGFRVAAYDPFVSDDVMAEAGVRTVSLEEALTEGDILSLHMPLSNDTRHLFNANAFARMKNSAILLNTSRGGLIHTTDLAQALNEGTIGGAGIDVFETEPLDENHPLRFSPNTILTSHTAWYSERSIPLLQKLAVDEVYRGMTGQPLKNRLV